jgi:hypothetical protein
MSEAEVRDALPEDSLFEIQSPPGGKDYYLAGLNDPELTQTEQWQAGGTIDFEDGYVVRATDNVASLSDPQAYELFVLLNELLVELTGGEDTCVVIRTEVPQQIFPQSFTYISFPQRALLISTAGRGDGDDGGIAFRLDAHSSDSPEGGIAWSQSNQSGRCIYD